MEQKSLDELAALVASGHGRAYKLLLIKTAQLVRAYVFARMGPASRHAVEDIVQETLMAVHLKFNSYDGARPCLPWLRTIARHKLIDYWRRQKHDFIFEVEDNPGADFYAIQDGSILDTQASDTRMTLTFLMGILNEKQRRVVTLARLEGMSMDEIASELGLSVSDVKVTLHRAIKKMSDAAILNTSRG